MKWFYVFINHTYISSYILTSNLYVRWSDLSQCLSVSVQLYNSLRTLRWGKMSWTMEENKCHLFLLDGEMTGYCISQCFHSVCHISEVFIFSCSMMENIINTQNLQVSGNWPPAIFSCLYFSSNHIKVSAVHLIMTVIIWICCKCTDCHHGLWCDPLMILLLWPCLGS